MMTDNQDNKDRKKDSKKDSKDQGSQEQPVSNGALLKAARQQKGLSLEIVHEETKIPLDALKAIEEGYKIRTLSEFYYKGFLKIYAKYLDVDVTKVVEKKPKAEIRKLSSRQEDEFNFEEWFAKVFTRKTKQQIVVALGMFLALFLLFKIITFFVSLVKGDGSTPAPRVVSTGPGSAEEKPQTPAVTAQEARVAPDSKETLTSVSQSRNTPKPDKPEPPPAAAASSPQVPAANGASGSKEATTESPQSPRSVKDVILTVRATKSSWLRVEVDGKVEFQSTLKLGSVETWFADEKIVISGRNISSLEFELNGKMIGKLGRKDRKVKEVVITEDGLQVSQ